ncbi:PQQ-binding-like beta-propeller repeat protein [Candidatus Bathyarchaeota archaeon]|nr:PQQ-binding-like beta-propeller repeat protein [Candidatus Bathyarchaeota archaeon]
MQKKLNKKLVTISFAILLIATMSASMMFLPTTLAHSPPWSIPTFAHVYAAINPIGVGQTTYIYMFLTPTYADTLMTNNYRFHNFNLTIVAPNGEVTNKIFETIQDTTSNQGYSFTPDQVGTYQIYFNFPGQNVNDYPYSPTSQFKNDTYLPSSASTTLVVQEEQVKYIDQAPLPTEYWTRPVYGENTMWFTIASNWLGSGAPGYGAMIGPNQRTFTDSAVGSLTNHVMWTKEVQPGGVVGDNNYENIANTYFEGTAYQQRFINPIIVYGRLYYKEPLSFANQAGDMVCVDLRTGQEVWRRSDIPALSFAFIYDLGTPNYRGVYPAVLFTSNFARAFDAYTGEPLFNVTGVPSGSAATTVFGPLGEHIRYTLFNNGTPTSPNWYLCSWNSSRMWGGSSTTWVPQQTTVNGVTAVQANQGRMYDYLDAATQNVSIAWRNSMPAAGGNAPSIIASFYNDILLCRNGSYPAVGDAGAPYTYFAVNLNASKGPIGQVLWWNTVPRPVGDIPSISFAGADAKAGVFCESYRQTQQFVGFDLRTGAKLWVGESQAALDFYGSPGPGTLSNVIAYGRIYSSAYSGIVYCYDMATGEVLWTYGNGGVGNSTNSGFEVPGPYPTFIEAIGNGVVYTATSEHTFQTPIYKGALARAINATTGEELWTVSAATGQFIGISYAIADGYSVLFNSYDQHIYSLGRGPTETEVDVGPKTIALGNTVVIEGTVIDISAGTEQNEQAARFPEGVPVSSDASMKDWMGYVYQQDACPTDFKGVDVTINVVDANGNYRTIGTAATDAKGYYSLVWTPDIEGKYNIFATFAGSKGYWPSSQETSFNVQSAPATASPVPTQAPSMADLYFLPAVIGIIIAIVVGIAAVLFVVSKKP